MSLPETETAQGEPAGKPDTELLPGALVRVCSGSYEGAIGELTYLFAHQQLFPSGIRARAARVRLEDGSHLVVPLPVLERIGGVPRRRRDVAHVCTYGSCCLL